MYFDGRSRSLLHNAIPQYSSNKAKDATSELSGSCDAMKSKAGLINNGKNVACAANNKNTSNIIFSPMPMLSQTIEDFGSSLRTSNVLTNTVTTIYNGSGVDTDTRGRETSEAENELPAVFEPNLSKKSSVEIVYIPSNISEIKIEETELIQEPTTLAETVGCIETDDNEYKTGALSEHCVEFEKVYIPMETKAEIFDVDIHDSRAVAIKNPLEDNQDVEMSDVIIMKDAGFQYARRKQNIEARLKSASRKRTIKTYGASRRPCKRKAVTILPLLDDTYNSITCGTSSDKYEDDRMNVTMKPASASIDFGKISYASEPLEMCKNLDQSNIRSSSLNLQNNALFEPKEQLKGNEFEHYSEFLIGSQLAYFFTEKLFQDKKPRMNLVIVNKGTSGEDLMKEKLPRIMKDIKMRSQFLGKLSTHIYNEFSTRFCCHTCRCSFFLKQEMLSHFKCLHPSEVKVCFKCNDEICGSQIIWDKHLQQHDALGDHSLVSQTNPDARLFEPDFIVMHLGSVNQSTVLLKQNEVKYVHPDMAQVIKNEHKNFVLNVMHNITKATGSKNMSVTSPITNALIESGTTFTKPRFQCRKTPCLHCNKLVSDTQLGKHIELCHQGGKYLLCSVCDKNFRDTGHEQPHMMQKSQYPLKCPKHPCNHRFGMAQTLNKHIWDVHTRLFCDICNKSFDTKNKLKYHMEKHEPSNFYYCHHCTRRFQVKDKLKEHIINAHGPYHACKICGKKYLKGSLKIHYNQVHLEPDKKVKCEYCDKYMHPDALRTHKYTKHSNRRKCTICKPYKTFRSYKDKNAHMLIHENDQSAPCPNKIISSKKYPYVQCPFCSKFLPRKNFHVHMKFHHSSESYVSLKELEVFDKPTRTPCCHCKALVQDVLLAKHIEMRHYGGETLMCRTCDTNYKETGIEQPHMFTESPSPFKCPKYPCKHGFLTEERLENHIKYGHQKKKTKKKVYVCEICGKFQIGKFALKKHIEYTHFPVKNKYSCDMCSFKTHSKSSITIHILGIHATKYPCKICGKKYTKLRMPSHYSIHQKMNFREKVACKICNKTVYADNLELHELTHRGIIIKCSICRPSYYFKTMRAKDEHMLKHERGEEIILPPTMLKVKCPYCPRAKIRRDLNFHLRSCHGIDKSRLGKKKT